ncbi:hypothetical protein TBLA_0A03260 [Henningerozyma blattae CBS 6284]|uniref:Uncharacterized protein n=1 Tax=Henningerozyma blattae (strain ATCC 34711 / CBS 6284 / DSM 70876 / NBRC 10599 / NRRL Y-10934 / UCD 77-7) TaxID=1071380 RepID=I2GVH4_HENB6|nr:hypothetical protein TBLA_0A03260 [Tetrapisispora blattae CBS 6284]CCH58126.1 hypothetical protein TBLA_0A03260 [Tetrapisispora blattae CBS 6284]
MHCPNPLKSLFIKFPLYTYPPISNSDDALSTEIKSKTFYFQSTADPTTDPAANKFILATYNTFDYSYNSSTLKLSTDPWCLFVQLSLAIKNNLQLPTDSPNTPSKHALSILSPHITPSTHLPVLIEDSSHTKRYTRNTIELHSTLSENYITHPSYKLLALSLDTILYDCYFIQLFYYLSNDEFNTLYSHQFESSYFSNSKTQLSTRNNFHQRNNHFLSLLSSSSSPLPPPLLQNSQHNLFKIIESAFSSTKPFLLYLENFTFDTSQTYFIAKLSSYILCILNVPSSTPFPLKQFIKLNCPNLIALTNLSFQFVSNGET